jgi:hypothetical protein
LYKSLSLSLEKHVFLRPKCWATGFGPGASIFGTLYIVIFVIVVVFSCFFFIVNESINMVDCNSITVFAAIGAVFLGYKFLGLLKALYDSFVASGIPVCIDIL